MWDLLALAAFCGTVGQMFHLAFDIIERRQKRGRRQPGKRNKRNIRNIVRLRSLRE